MGTTDRTPFPETPGLEPPVERTDFFSSSPVLFPVSHPAGREEKVFVTRDRIRLARKADLARFLLQRHPDLFRNSGSTGTVCTSEKDFQAIRISHQADMETPSTS